MSHELKTPNFFVKENSQDLSSNQRLAAENLEHAKGIIAALKQREALMVDAGLMWAIETMRSIAIFCVAGAAGAFTVMQITHIQMPVLQGTAGALFLIGLTLCIWRMQRSARSCGNVINLIELRLQYVKANSATVTLAQMEAPLLLPEDQEKYAQKTNLIAKLSAISSIAGASLLIGSIFYRSLTQ